MRRSVNLPRFIASRIRSRTERRSFSSTVTRIGIASIAIGLAVMMVAFAVLFGFQGTVREKLFSLSAHMKVTRYTLNQSYEETALPRDSRLSRSYKTLPDIAHFQMVAHKAGILQTDEAVQGVLLKGVGPDFNWKSFGQNLTEGRLPAFGKDSTDSKEILISRSIANQLQLKTGDKVTMIIMQYPPRPRRLTITGIYDTGLEELDKQLIIGDLRLVQKLNKWGPDTVGGIRDFCEGL